MRALDHRSTGPLPNGTIPTRWGSGIVYLVDDNPGVQKALERFFRSVGCRVRTFDSSESFLEEVSPADAGCLVLDIMMAGMDGLALQERLSSLGFTVPVIFITGYGSVPASVRAMKWGAVDFFEKPLDHDALLKAVAAAIEDDRARRRDLSGRDDARQAFDPLTPREFEVMTYMIGGVRNRDIARALGISERTVKVHRGRVMKKMDTPSLAELIQAARGAGISAHALSPGSQSHEDGEAP